MSSAELTVAEPEMQPAMRMSAGARFRYDVFISYSHKDAAWVQIVFRKELEKAGLKVGVDTRDFPIGVPSAKNMVEAIQQARHIVAVLTPNWVDSEWTGFEGYLVTTIDPTGKQRRLLPVMFEPCKPPPHIAFLTYADFTDPDRRSEEMQRLLRAMKTQEELHDALPVHISHAKEYARDGLDALVDLMRQPEVRDTVVEYRAFFRDTRKQVDIIGNYKDLHDQLHELQIQCYNPLLREIPRFPDDPLALENLTDRSLRWRAKSATCATSLAAPTI